MWDPGEMEKQMGALNSVVVISGDLDHVHSAHLATEIGVQS